ncbi:MAG: hypothetical protein ACYTGG_09275 [Planctomycetota bacterium]|jgi:hypothetical protein
MRTFAAGVVIGFIVVAIGCGGGTEAEVRGIPEVVWDGGAATVTVDVNFSGPGTLFVAFTDREWDETGQHFYTARELQGIDELPSGRHQFEIDVPSGVNAFFDAKLDEPERHATIDWQINVNGHPAWDERITLNGPPSRYNGLSAKVRFDDVASGQIAQVGLWD